MIQYDLPAMVKRVGKVRKPVTLAEIKPPKALQTDLARIYMRVVNQWAAICRERLLPLYASTLDEIMRDSVDEMAAAQEQSGNLLTRLFALITPELNEWAIAVEAWHRRRFVASILPTGVDVSTLIGPADSRMTMQVAVDANVALVRSVSDQTRERIAGVIFRGFQQRLPARTVAKQMNDAVGLGRKRSMRIASDQLAKLSSALDEERFRQADIEKYEWAWSGKLHPRDWHKARNGKVFPLSGDGAVPKGDAPGEPPFCGCRRRARLEL